MHINSHIKLKYIVIDMITIIVSFSKCNTIRKRLLSQFNLKSQCNFLLLSPVYINFVQGAKILLASHFDLEYVLGHKIAFLCVARGNPRPHVTWFKDGAEIYTHHYLHVSEYMHLQYKKQQCKIINCGTAKSSQLSCIYNQ